MAVPQELTQLPTDALIVLKAGAPATRGRKIIYYRDRRFTDRLKPAPEVPLAPGPKVLPTPPAVIDAQTHDDETDFDAIVRRFEAEGLTPPRPGASEAEVGDWLDRLVDAPVVAQPSREDRIP